MAPSTAADKCIAERATQSGRIQRIRAKIPAATTITSIDYNLSQLETITLEVRENHRKLIVACDPADVPAHETDLLDLLDEVDDIAMQLAEAKAKIAATSTIPKPSSSTHSDMRLPKMDLPKFNGNINDWLSFKDLFTSVHDRTHLSDAEKLSYLQVCLTEEASNLVKSLPITNANYKVAWDQLENRYHHKRELVFRMINRFISQSSLVRDSASGLRSLVDTSRQCVQSLETLKVSVDKWDAILVYIILQKLDKDSRRAFELTLTTTGVPSFDDLITYLNHRATAISSEGGIDNFHQKQHQFIPKSKPKSQVQILFQQLWKLDLDWDDQLSESIQEDWNSFRSNLHLIENIRINRCFNLTNSKLYLHGFCDASESAYAAVVYVRAEQASGKSQVSLVAAKTRVAPAKTVSLPRLELCGAVLLVNLMESVKNSVQLDFEDCYAWTDSTIVLAWLQSHPSRWKTFVANRVATIQEIIPSTQWSHVSGLENPADCASRGIDPADLISHPLWWYGPTWLRDLNKVSQHSGPTPNSEELQQEEKAVKLSVNVLLPGDSLIFRYSSLLKLKRITAWCFRFYYNVRVKSKLRQFGPLTPLELDNALMSHVKLVQAGAFGSDIHHLKLKQPLPNKSKILSLNPFLDSHSILRVGGRLVHANININQKHPILLPRHHKLTEIIVRYEHIANLHAGPQLLQSILQKKFWIIRAKDVIRHQVKKCIGCAKHGATLHQIMGDLPAARVNPGRPFLKCGVDYAGPVTLRAIPGRSKVTYKAYLSLFICFVTKAVHLEIVSSLSTDAFLATLKRFVSRRGKPSDMYSDCGTNFVGADRELKDLLSQFKSQQHNEEVANQLSAEGINWHFNPPGAPRFGGLWEAGVKSVKFHLARIVGPARLTFEELSTAVAQIEACLNSRPLTSLSTDPNDLQALTPGHFLVGDHLKAVPEPDLSSERLNRLNRWQLVQQLRDHFWHRWSTEYLARLQQRPKWLKQQTDIKLNDLVLIKEEKNPAHSWPLARVIDLHPGQDNRVRVATLKTSNGTLKRPLTKLCLLPIEDTSTDSASTVQPEIPSQSF